MRLNQAELKKIKAILKGANKIRENLRVSERSVWVWLLRKALISLTVIGSSMMIANKQDVDIWIDKIKIQPGSRVFW